MPGASSSLTVSSARRGRASFVALVALMVVLAGCSPSNDPSRYTDEVEKNFLTACTEGSEGKLGTEAAAAYCGCVYDGLRAPPEQGGISFDDFKSLDNDLRNRIGDDVNNRDDLAKVNARYLAIIDTCSSSGPRAAASPTTAVATTTSR